MIPAVLGSQAPLTLPQTQLSVPIMHLQNTQDQGTVDCSGFNRGGGEEYVNDVSKTC